MLALVTGAKSFRDNPVIGSTTLNRLGLHILRVKLAHFVMQCRWLMLSPLMPKEYRKEYRRNGFVVIPDFISKKQVKALRRDIAGHTGPVRQLTQGNTATQRILLDKAATENYPALKALTENPTLAKYLSYAGGKLMAPLLYVQRIRNGKGSDPQKSMHSDTFHPTMKAWLFLEDVKDKNGPFTYVRGSHHFTPLRLAWEYERSTQPDTRADKYSEKGSLRATEDDLASMNLPKPTAVTVTAGSLVIANTNGFHGRGKAKAGASRLEIWAFSRHTPFNPLPGLIVPGWKNLRHTIIQAYWRRKDKEAAIKGSKASWHLIPATEMLDDIPPKP